MQKVEKQSTKRIYYKAGLISIILLPALCIWNIHKNTRPQLGYIEFTPAPLNGYFWIGPQRPDDWRKKSNHPDRNYFEVDLTGKDTEDRIKLDYANLKVRDLIKNKDSIDGIHFHFADNSHYWSFIQVYDICETDSAQCYITYKNDTWIWVPKTEKPIKEKYSVRGGFCGGVHLAEYYDPDKIPRELAKKRQEKIAYLTGLAKDYWPSEVLFLSLIISALVSSRRSLIS